MKPFSFVPAQFAQDFKSNGFAHIRGGVTAELFGYAKEQLECCRRSGHNELPGREIKGKKKQYLFDLPRDREFLGELFEAVGALSGTLSSAMTLSERHIMSYDENAIAEPPLHKDRLASELSIGIPLEPSERDCIVLSPYVERGINLLNTAVYCDREPLSAAGALERHGLTADHKPIGHITQGGLVELDARPGDVVVFRGSSMYHGRLRAARSSILYFKVNTMGLDPLGEDPATERRRGETLALLQLKTDEELLDSVVELTPRLQHIDRRYSRLGWKSVLRVSIGGEREFTISENDLGFILALRGPRRVRDILLELGCQNDQLVSRAPDLRMLGTLGAVDFVD